MTRYAVHQDAPQGRQLVSEPLRIVLRLIGAVMLIAGTAAIVLLFNPGPYKAAEAMGESCVHGDPRPTQTEEQCNVLDVIELSLGAPVMVLVGLVLIFTMSKSFVQPDPPRAGSTPISQLAAARTTPFDRRSDAATAKQAQELLAEWQRPGQRGSVMIASVRTRLT
jgi:hypothetical protein